jgi:hypothetical protein
MLHDMGSAGKKCGRAVAIAALALIGNVAALACPVCDTDTGREVRAGIFGDDFGRNVLLTVAPLPAVLLLAALACRAVPEPRGFSRDDSKL